MNEFQKFHSDLLAASVEIFGDAIVYKGQTYKCVANSIEYGGPLEWGGELPTYDTVIIVQRCDFNAAPQVGETLVTDGKIVRIEKVTSDLASYELKCMSAGRAQ